MKRQILLGALMLAASASLNAQGIFEKHHAKLTLPQHYVCYHPEGKIKVDGKLDEPSWQKAQSTVPFSDISGEGFAEPAYETTAKMLWDDNYLYVAAWLEEDNIKAVLKQRDTIIYHDNDFEVFLDPDGDGQNYFEIETNAIGTLFDLMLDRSYRTGGNFMIQWDCPGIQLAVKRDGTLNKPSDKDKGWAVEMAIPGEALKMNFDNPLKAGACWRMNFSRVEWLKPGQREENWVWSPTGKIDMHMPDRWSFLYLSDNVVGTATEEFSYPYDMDAYRLLWAMFYEQLDSREKSGRYITNLAGFGLTAAETACVPEGGYVDVEATDNQFRIVVSVPEKGVRYTVDHNGKFAIEK